MDVGGVRTDGPAGRGGRRRDQLSNKEFELLRVIIRRAGQVVTREEILCEVWNDPYMKTSKTLDMHMSWLRRKRRRRAADRDGARGRLPFQPRLDPAMTIRLRGPEATCRPPPILQSAVLVVTITAWRSASRSPTPPAARGGVHQGRPARPARAGRGTLDGPRSFDSVDRMSCRSRCRPAAG